MRTVVSEWKPLESQYKILVTLKSINIVRLLNKKIKTLKNKVSIKSSKNNDINQKYYDLCIKYSNIISIYKKCKEELDYKLNEKYKSFYQIRIQIREIKIIKNKYDKVIYKYSKLSETIYKEEEKL